MQRSKLLATSLFLATLTLPGAAWAQGSDIIQQGRGNAAGILQTGSGNDAGIRQFGRGNMGVIAQTGSSNSACLIQSGRNLDGAIVQSGDNLSAGLLQTRWGTSEIPADACASVTSRRQVFAYIAGRTETLGGPPVLSRGRRSH